MLKSPETSNQPLMNKRVKRCSASLVVAAVAVKSLHTSV